MSRSPGIRVLTTGRALGPGLRQTPRFGRLPLAHPARAGCRRIDHSPQFRARLPATPRTRPPATKTGLSRNCHLPKPCHPDRPRVAAPARTLLHDSQRHRIAPDGSPLPPAAAAAPRRATLGSITVHSVLIWNGNPPGPQSPEVHHRAGHARRLPWILPWILPWELDQLWPCERRTGHLNQQKSEIAQQIGHAARIRRVAMIGRKRARERRWLVDRRKWGGR